MLDQKLELAYISGNLYGNIKQKEYIKENPIELKDVVQFKALYNKDINTNQQQKKLNLAACKYEVVCVEGDDISLRHMDGEDKIHKIPRSYIRNIEKQPAYKYLIPNVVQPDTEEHYIDVMPAKPFSKIGDEMKWIYNADQHKWENIGFPSNWRPEEMYEAFKKICDKLT